MASVLAGAVAATALFGYALTSRGGQDDMQSEALNVEMAVPAAAVNAAQQGFADRTETVSRNAVRSNLAQSVAGVAAEDREEVMDASATNAYEQIAQQTAEYRHEANEADLELVAAQEEKLQEEAAEAARRLEEARLAAEAAQAGDATGGEAGNAGMGEISDEDLAAATSTGASMPLKSGYRIGAGFGATGRWSRYHTGQDFPAPTGTPIYAVASGIVLSPTAGGWAGINVVIQHSNGGSTLYAHMSKRVVSPGQAVQAGQLIGYVGNTGRSFGSHLHLEYYQAGVTPGDVYRSSNPMSFLRSLGVR